MTSLNPHRIDTASRVIKATPRAIYAAYLDVDAVKQWRPPTGMTGEVYEFDPRMGGGYRMAFVYGATDQHVQGKTSAHADVFRGEFVELVPNERIVERVTFESDDPAFAEPMTIITTLTPVEGGTEVAIRIENVPSSITPEDHQQGMDSSLENLAKFTEAIQS